MTNILIVCTANKCRSVMAETIAADVAAKKRKSLEYNFKSAGVAAIGSALDISALRVLSEHGLETAHEPIFVGEYNPDTFDFIHVMTERHKVALCAYFKEKNISGKITVLNIEDPYGRGIDEYRDCYNRLREFYFNFI